MIQKQVKYAATNFKTTIAGFVAFLAIVTPQVNYIFDNDELTNPDWNVVVAALSVFFAGLFARDSNVSTEETRGNKPRSV